MIMRLVRLLQLMCRLFCCTFLRWRGLVSLVILLLIGSFPAQAQESGSVLPYAHRLFLNPAFTGLLSDYSVTAGHRSQWTGISPGFSTQMVSGEYRFLENKNAVGATFLSDKAPGNGYQKVQANALYAYHTKLKQKLDLSAGLQIGYGAERPGTKNLIFEDQLGPDGTVTQPTTETFSFERKQYLSLGAGLLLFTRQFWVGLSGAQLNSPSVGEGSGSTVAPTFQLQTGYRFYLKSYFSENKFEEISFVPTLSYLHQRAFKRLDASIYANFTPFTIGVGATMLPGTKNTPLASTIQGVAGVTHKGFKIGYGYRHPVSENPVALGPTHELVLSFEKVDYEKIFKRSGSDKKYNRIACPAF
jgi:type IX secretion system PorP/SprF family membrane protein